MAYELTKLKEPGIYSYVHPYFGEVSEMAYPIPFLSFVFALIVALFLDVRRVLSCQKNYPRYDFMPMPPSQSDIDQKHGVIQLVFDNKCLTFYETACHFGDFSNMLTPTEHIISYSIFSFFSIFKAINP